MSIATHMPDLVAPWAKAVPGVGPATVDILLSLPDDGYRYEVVEGVLVRMAGSCKYKDVVMRAWLTIMCCARGKDVYP